MFNFSLVLPSYDVIRKLCSGIPNKTKLVVGWRPEEIHSETLLVAVRPFYDFTHVLMLLLDILNKRWQTLDLVSMMYECKRSASFHEMGVRNLYPLAERLVITDTLSSLPKFKREEDLS